MVELAMAPCSTGASYRQSRSLQRSLRTPCALFSTHHQNPTCLHSQKGHFLTGPPYPQPKPSSPQALQQPQQDQPACLQILPAAHYATLLQSCRIQNSVLNSHDLIIKSGLDQTVFLQNMLIQMYGRCGCVEHSCSSFLHAHLPDRYSWSFMIKCFAQQDQAALQEGKWLHSCLAESGSELDDVLKNSLLTMYGRCGSIADARAIFDKTRARSLALWNAMVEVYAENGQGKHALELFSQICDEKVIPNESTFVSVLSACSHSGLVEEAYMYLVSMPCDYGIVAEVDHYNCMVDLLGRAGRLEEAENIILNMPCRSTSVSWLTLLSACKEHIDVIRGEYAAEWASVLDCKNAVPFLILSNLFLAVGREKDSARVIQKTREVELESSIFCTTTNGMLRVQLDQVF